MKTTWYSEIQRNNPTTHPPNFNPTGRSRYIAGLLNPHAYPPTNNPSYYSMFQQYSIVINKKRGLKISIDLSYQCNEVSKITRTSLFKHSRMICYGFTFDDEDVKGTY